MGVKVSGSLTGSKMFPVSSYILIHRYILAITRTLFTPETLDTLSYGRYRSELLENTESLSKFKWQLMCYLDNEPKKELSVMTKAAEILVHIMCAEKDDCVLIQQLLQELNNFEDYSDKAKSTFGNLIMKALHTLNAWDTMREVSYKKKKRNYHLSDQFHSNCFCYFCELQQSLCKRTTP